MGCSNREVTAVLFREDSVTIFSRRAFARIFFVLCMGSATISSFGDNAVVLTGRKVSEREAARAVKTGVRRKKQSFFSCCGKKIKAAACEFKQRWQRLRKRGKSAAIIGLVLGVPAAVFVGVLVWMAGVVSAMTPGCPCALLGPMVIGGGAVLGLLISAPLCAASSILAAVEWRRAGRDEPLGVPAKPKKKRQRREGGRFLFWRW